MAMLTAEIFDRAPPRQQMRKSERRPINGAANCRRGIARETVNVLDLSLGGVRVRSIVPLRVGHVVFLRIGSFEAFEARIMWTRGCESGCEFARPLHPAVFESIAPRR